ncbi:MAG: hypothetical protein WCO33_04315 [bacterium]
MKLPTSLTTVTPLSKILALIIFVSLPLVCFILGVNYGVSLGTFNIKYNTVSSTNSSFPTKGVVVTSSQSSTSSLICGITNCHGVDVTCGNVTEQFACTAMYALGDKCRQYVSCQTTNGTCEKVVDPRYTSCVSCVQKCNTNFPNDPVGASSCESRCQ